MLDKISILITGNPTSGALNIGEYGTGLSPNDPDWPMNASGDYVMTITEKDYSTVYCLIFKSTLISANNSTRGGILNFQLKIPFGYAITDAGGNKVSPYSFLMDLFKVYEKAHLTKYPGVDGWNFSGDGKMTAEEFRQFTAPYSMTGHLLPPRHLTGAEPAVLILDEQGMEAITLDYAYPELTRFGKIILSPRGTNTPNELARLEIPRRPLYEVFVNGAKMDCLVRDGEEPFSLPVNPRDSYLLPTQLTVDFRKAYEEGRVDIINERIDYRVKFEEKEKTYRVKVKLTGCEDDAERRIKILKDILNGIYLKGSDGFYAGTGQADKSSWSKIFTIRGRSTELPFTTEWPRLDNVSLVSDEEDYDGKVLVFRYNKPKSISKPKEDKKALNIGTHSVGSSSTKPKQTDTKVSQEQASAKLDVSFFAKDEAILEQMDGSTFDIEISADNNPTLTYHLPYKHQAYNENGLTDNKIEIKIPASYLQGAKVEADSNDNHFELDVERGSIQYDNISNTCIVVIHVSKVSALELLKPKLIRLSVLLVVFALGWYIGETYQPMHHTFNSETRQEEKTADDNNKESDDNPSKMSDDTAQDDDSAQDGDKEENEVRGEAPAADDKSKVSQEAAGTSSEGEAANSAALNKQASEYLNLIKKSDLTFQKVNEINNWIEKNKANSRSIQGYNNLKKVVKTYVQAMMYVKQINGDWDERFPGEINKFIKGLPTDPEYTNLRRKMQNLNNGNTANNTQVATNLILFANKHPNGVTSFAEISL